MDDDDCGGEQQSMNLESLKPWRFLKSEILDLRIFYISIYFFFVFFGKWSQNYEWRIGLAISEKLGSNR